MTGVEFVLISMFLAGFAAGLGAGAAAVIIWMDGRNG